MLNNWWIRFVLFIILNFAALGLGSFLMDDGPMGSWYQNLARAPWEPPGWVFGVTWTLIMLCLSIFMAQVWRKEKSNAGTIIGIYVIQLIFNVLWNPVFFKWHLPVLALVVISTLLFFVYLLFREGKKFETKPINLLLLPYLIWLGIAISLNIYVVLNN